MKPYVVIPAKNVKKEFMLIPGVIVAATPNGWMNEFLALDWIEKAWTNLPSPNACLCGIRLNQCSSTFLSSWNPWYTFAFVMEPHYYQKCKKHELLVRESCISGLDISTNNQQQINRYYRSLKSKKFNHSVVSCIFGMYLLHSEFRHPAKRTRIGTSNMFRPIFQLWQLNYIWSASD